jgi:glucose-1-phosphate cytidylyltransferase
MRLYDKLLFNPKHMLGMGKQPILSTLIIYPHLEFNYFIKLPGYKGFCIKEYFSHYILHEYDKTFDFTIGIKTFIHIRLAESRRAAFVEAYLERTAIDGV